MKIWDPNDTMIDFKRKGKNNPKKLKIGISNPERYDEHPYHFTI